MGSTAEHQKLVDDLLFAFGSMPLVRCWPRQVGFAYTITGAPIKFGMPGESDIGGIVAPYGFVLCIEVKTGNAVLSKKQKLFKAMILRFGGIYILARSVEQAVAEFELEIKRRNNHYATNN